jgi:hypothetical protein
MHARVATFELGDDPDQMIEAIRSDVESETPPAGLQEVRGITMLVDRSGGKAMAILLFEDEAAMARGDAVLNEMSPSGPSRRTGVDFYEVAIQRLP